MQGSLIVVSGKGEGDYYPLGERGVAVGRDEACEIQVLDEQVSRRHLQVDFDKKQKAYRATDLNSSNGVSVNGRRLTASTPSALTDGDIIELGSTRLMFAAREFPDRKSAWDYYKLSGERGRKTLIR